ncbi:velvet factor-domain-containing protein [Mycena capillaripes]|nr:velvet factor-domain-containing protein [Mycena capillaripes]
MVFRRSEPQRSPASLRHELVIRQMPVQAQRRTLDPLPAVELVFFESSEDDATGRRVQVPLYQLTGYTLFAALVDAENEDEVEYLPDGQTDALCGIFISSLFPVRDPAEEDKRPTLFFAFPDLGVRATGRFRLRFTLSLFGPKECSTRMSVYSPPFSVVTAAKYGGVQNSTLLTRALASSGAHARIRNRARGARPRSGRLPDSIDSPPSSGSSASPDVLRSPLRGRPSATRIRPRERTSTALILHAPRPLYPALRLHGALAALLTRATEGGASRPASVHPQWRFPSAQLQQRKLPDKQIEMNCMFTTPGILMTPPVVQPSAFDVYLANWYSDDIPVVLDGAGSMEEGWMN